MLRPNTHFSFFLQIKQILESHVQCFVFMLWLDMQDVAQQVGVKFYICDRAGRKMYNMKLVCFMLYIPHIFNASRETS